MHAVLGLASLLAITACRSRPEGSALQSTPVKFTPATTEMVRLKPDEKDRLVEAMHEIRREFYETTAGYSALPPGITAPPSAAEIETCMTVTPPTWSDLMAHYYCTYPGYEPRYFPNIRECFTYLLLPNLAFTIAGKRPSYQEVYDYCVFMPTDRKDLVKDGPFANWSTSAGRDFPPLDRANVAAGEALGALKWVHERQGDIFQFVMFGGPCTVHPDDQQEVINRVYGVDLKGKVRYTAADKEQVDACKKRTKRVGSPPKYAKDPLDGTHCSYDMREKLPLAKKCI